MTLFTLSFIELVIHQIIPAVALRRGLRTAKIEIMDPAHWPSNATLAAG